MMADRPPRRRRRARWRLVLALAVTLLTVACGTSGDDQAGGSPALSSEGSAGVIRGEMVVQAA
ncbi:MAG TPA: hypothetical protein VMM13_12295, partial [Euzebya sp.]|nr:hypothetical protein [Euzebya sp.]